jgi:imidazolonepropionase-like amidohydrolase
MRRFAPLGALAVVMIATACTPSPTPSSEPREVVYRGARLLVGDGGPPIEGGTFAVADGRITRVGPAGALTPESTVRVVDLSGKTVMPAMIDAHAHIGYMRDLTSGPENYTRENILDHMRRYAWFGVAAGMAMGSDFGDLPYAVRDETAAGRPPEAARFLTAGRGLAPPDEVRPDNMRHSAYSIDTPEAARAAIRELKSRGVAIVKTWVDDRGGRVRKMPPEVYGAIIDEAHANGMQVMVHATGLNDAKALLRRGVDGFGHAFLDVDDELVTLVRERPNVFYLFALGGPRRLVHAPWLDAVHPLVAATVSPAQIERLRQRVGALSDAERAAARRAWDAMAAGIARLAAAGARIGVGTDGGGQLGDQFVGWTVHTEVENMVAAGMTAEQVLKAATSTSAEIVGLTDVGRLAPGYSADFVVLDANPLDDITNTRHIAQVFLRGVGIDRAALQRAWGGSIPSSTPGSRPPVP